MEKSLDIKSTTLESNIIGLLLNNGIEIIGRVIEENDDYIIMDDVLKIMYKYSGNNTFPSVYLFKYTILTGNFDHTFKKSEINNFYLDLTTETINFFKEYIKDINKEFTTLKLINELPIDDTEDNELLTQFLNMFVNKGGSMH
jgi:hypothetical protein